MLQLVRRNGSYYGPIVLARKGRRAHEALSGRSVRLGQIRLRGGWAVLKRRVSTRAVSRRLSTRANRRGKPVGAGKLGLVRKPKRKKRGASASASKEQRLDADSDGIPNVYDVDDDGDKVLDSVESGSGEGEPGRLEQALFSNLKLPMERSLNLNGAGVTRDQVDSLIKDDLTVVFDIPAATFSSADVDCFGLSYCKAGAGTAEIQTVSGGEPPPDLPVGSKWTSYDPNGNGLPNLYRSSQGGAGTFSMIVFPRATTAQIAPGDSYNFLIRLEKGDTETVPGNLDFYFVTTPGLINFDHGTGPNAVSYPIQPEAPGTSTNTVQLASDRITMTFWRPQRPAIKGAETGSFIDIGHLKYGVALAGGVGNVLACPFEDYSGLSPTLKASGDKPPEPNPLLDTADDAPANPTNTLSFTLDIGSCLRRNGINQPGLELDLDLEARDERGDNAAQKLRVRMPG